MFGKCVLVRSNSDSEASAVQMMSCVVLENQGEPPEISRKCPIYYLYRNETRLASVIGKEGRTGGVSGTIHGRKN